MALFFVPSVGPPSVRALVPFVASFPRCCVACVAVFCLHCRCLVVASPPLSVRSFVGDALMVAALARHGRIRTVGADTHSGVQHVATVLGCSGGQRKNCQILSLGAHTRARALAHTHTRTQNRTPNQLACPSVRQIGVRRIGGAGGVLWWRASSCTSCSRSVRQRCTEN